MLDAVSAPLQIWDLSSQPAKQQSACRNLHNSSRFGEIPNVCSLFAKNQACPKHKFSDMFWLGSEPNCFLYFYGRIHTNETMPHFLISPDSRACCCPVGSTSLGLRLSQKNCMVPSRRLIFLHDLPLDASSTGKSYIIIVFVEC